MAIQQCCCQLCGLHLADVLARPLAAFYPHPNDQLALWQVLLAIAFLIAITLLAIHWRKERPYVFTGWFWYVGMLVPVIGLVEAGEQARADRHHDVRKMGLYRVVALA